MVGVTDYVEPAPHEFAANFLFNEYGLTPFFALDRRVKEGGGSQRATFVDDGECWTVTLYYQSSNIVHPGAELPSGTPWRLDEMREFRLKVARNGEEDPVGEQSFNAHVTPRWQGMEARRGDGWQQEISVPEQLREAVNVRVQGSNIRFARYAHLLQAAITALDVRGEYFADPHPFSNVQDAERYVRVHKDKSGPVHARDGPLARLGHLLEHDRQGYRKTVQNDDDDYGRNCPGYYHTVTLGPRRIREAFLDHALPKEIKHYYAREAVSQPDSSPLAHPKVGVSYQVSRWKNTLGVTSEDLAQLEYELDQTLLSVLASAGLNIAPDARLGPFVPDAYFEPTGYDEAGPEPVSLDLTRIESNQQSVVIRHLADGLSPVQWESLETLVTDGGTVSPASIATEHDRHVESVRRALRGLEDLVCREYGEVTLRSKYIGELVYTAIREARDATRRAVDTTAKALEAADRGLGEHVSEFIAWAAKHGISVDDALNHREGRMVLRFGEPGRGARRAIREGYMIWKETGLPVERFRTAEIWFNDGSTSRIWHYLPHG